MKIEFFEKFKNEINAYCKNNDLNLDELLTHPISFNDESIDFYYKIEDTKEFEVVHGEHKLKPLLNVYLEENKLKFKLNK